MKSFEKAFMKRYPKCGYVITRMKEFDPNPTWDKFTRPYLIDLARHFRACMSDSSARVSLAYVKAILNDYSETIDIPTTKFKEALTVRDSKSAETWLTEEELERLDFETETERTILYDFLIGAYTGARYSDFITLDRMNVTTGLMSYTSMKTATRATVPIKPIVNRMLMFPRSNVSSRYFNKIIKEICRRSGVDEEVKLYKAGKSVSGPKWQFVSSHTARRSFATNLYLRGVDIVSIGKMMGHSSIEMTKRYIVCGLRELPDEAMGYFE